MSAKVVDLNQYRMNKMISKRIADTIDNLVNMFDIPIHETTTIEKFGDPDSKVDIPHIRVDVMLPATPQQVLFEIEIGDDKNGERK